MQEPLCRRPARAAMEAPAVAHGGSGLSPCFRRGLSAAARRRAHGLTLVELLVAVGILSMMILAFATIMNQSRKVVTGSQSIMRANTAAEAIMQSFRDSIRRMTQNGFLCIDTFPSANLLVNDSPQLFLTTAGIADSKTQGQSGTASIAGFGLCPDSSIAGQCVLWHQNLLLKTPPAGGWPASSDIWGFDLKDIQGLPRDVINSGIHGQLGAEGNVAGNRPADLPSSPGSLAEVNNAWKLLAQNCKYLTISWTDGSPGPFLQWYDKDNPKDSNWKNNSISTVGAPVEFNAKANASDPDRYRALWTKDNQSNWPRAIRVRFWLNDPTMQEFTGPNGMFYEVICPVAR